MSKRESTQNKILELFTKLDPTGYNTEQYKKFFASLSDKEFDEFMKDIRDKKKSLVFYKPPFKVQKTNIENNLALAKELGVEFFTHLKVYPSDGSEPYMTKNKYLVIDLPVRRQSQNLVKKTSIPPHNATIDLLTYQPTGDSKGAKVSLPELHILNAMRLDNSILELMKFRGGDRNGFNAYNAMAMRYGSISLKAIAPYASGVESTATLKAFLAAMHIRSTL